MTEHHSNRALRGRRRECEALEGVLEDARGGRSRVLVLRGEAGIGKSALLDHLGERASGCRVTRTTGVESEMAFSFAGLHRVCAPMLDDLDALPGPQRDALVTIFGLVPGPPPDQFLLGLAVLGLLTDAADGSPLVCLVDDAQWLDPSSALTLEFVARRLDAEPVAMVFAVREPGAALLAGFPELHIAGLDDDDARALFDSVASGPLDARVRDRVIAECHGNPLALLELPRGLSTAELELGFGSHDSRSTTTRLEQGFLRQLQHVPDDTRRLLLAAAVEPLGDVTLLWRAADHLGIAPAAMSPAEDLGLISLNARVSFRHPLVRSAVYRAASMSQLRAVHAALAEATDAERDPERRAWHRAHAAAGPDEEVALELERAARVAAGRGALVTAGTLMERALELTPDPAKRGARAIDAAYTQVWAAQPDAALRSIRAAELCPLDPRQRAQVALSRAGIVAVGPKLADAGPLFLEAAELFHSLDAASAREAYLCALGARMWASRLGGDEALRAVARTARLAPPGPEPPRPLDLVLEGLAIRLTEGYEAGLAPARRALAACTEEVEPNQQFLMWMWFAPLLATETWDDARWDGVTAHTVRLNRDADAFSSLPVALEYRAEFELYAGNLDTASELLVEADTILELTGSASAVHTSTEIAAWRGDEARALELIGATIRLMGGRSGRNIGLAENARAVLFNGLGRYEDALGAAQRACEFDDLGLYGRCLVERIEAGARASALDDTAASLRVLEERALAAGSDWALAALARSRALLSDDERAEPLYREAIERFARTRLITHLARAHLIYGEWLRRQNRRIDARAQLHRAYAMLDEMGAAAFAERAHRELAATGETVRKRSLGASPELTAQEAQIARLAAEGATNPEIGSRLFISPRTVEYHMSKVFVKLGIRSRRDLRQAVATVRQPLPTS